MESKAIKSLVNNHLEGSEVFLVDLRETPGKLTVFVDCLDGLSIAQCADLNRFVHNVPELHHSEHLLNLDLN